MWRFFYGRGNWPGLRVEKLYAEYLLPVCSPLLLTGDKALKTPADLAQHTLLHDASRRDWQTYTRQLGLSHINVQQGRFSAIARCAAGGHSRAGRGAGQQRHGAVRN